VHVDGGLGRALELLRVDANHRRHITADDTRTARAEGRAQRLGDNVVVLATSADPAASTAARLSAAPLSAHTLSVLRNGDGDTDRSATLQRILVGMVNRGWTFDAAWDAVCVRRHRGAAKLHEKLERRGPDAARAYLAHCWASALAWVEANPPVACDPDDAARIEALLLEADTHRWSGEAGAAAWMVLHALCVIGHRGPGVVLGASERDLAERCALSRATVHRALQTLQDRGWITCWETGRGPVASTWRLEVDDRPLREAARTDEPLPQPPTPHSTVGGVVENGLTMRAGADAFRRDALGPNGYRVLRLLLLWGPQSRTELAERLGLHPGTIARVLERCAATGLAERRNDASWALTEHTDPARSAPEAPAAPAGRDVDPVTGEISGAAPAQYAEASKGQLEEATARTEAPRRRRAYLACEPSALAAAAVAHGTLGAAARQRALHASERAVYAQSAAYHAAARALRREAPAARHQAVAA
jgi:DNA-binding MarR family transcriptional regulator